MAPRAIGVEKGITMNMDKYGVVHFRNPSRLGASSGHFSLGGQYLVDSWQNGLLHFVRLITMIQLFMLALVASTTGLPEETLTDPRSLVILFAPVATIPIFLFVLIKEQYRLRALAAVATVAAVVWLAVSLI